MVNKESNLRAGVYKVQTFGTLQRLNLSNLVKYDDALAMERFIRTIKHLNK